MPLVQACTVPPTANEAPPPFTLRSSSRFRSVLSARTAADRSASSSEHSAEATGIERASLSMPELLLTSRAVRSAHDDGADASLDGVEQRHGPLLQVEVSLCVAAEERDGRRLASCSGSRAGGARHQKGRGCGHTDSNAGRQSRECSDWRRGLVAWWQTADATPLPMPRTEQANQTRNSICSSV